MQITSCYPNLICYAACPEAAFCQTRVMRRIALQQTISFPELQLFSPGSNGKTPYKAESPQQKNREDSLGNQIFTTLSAFCRSNSPAICILRQSCLLRLRLLHSRQSEQPMLYCAVPYCHNPPYAQHRQQRSQANAKQWAAKRHANQQRTDHAA